MNVAIIGLPQSGKSVLFELLTAIPIDTYAHNKNIGIVKIPDHRLDYLHTLYPTAKKTPAEIMFIDAGGVKNETKDDLDAQGLRDADVFLEVIRAFADPAVRHPLGKISPGSDAKNLETSMVITDLELVTKTLDKINKEVARGRKERIPEQGVLVKCQKHLEDEKPLRTLVLSPDEGKLVRGYKFLSIKPKMLLINIGESGVNVAAEAELISFARQNNIPAISICVKIELEISKLSLEDQAEFLKDANIATPAKEQVIRACFSLLNLINFFTVGEDEVRAWTINKDLAAVESAGKIHSDIKRGFIKAEVINYEEFISFDSLQTARSKGKLRFEGKDYKVRDGDIIEFKFNV